VEWTKEPVFALEHQFFDKERASGTMKQEGRMKERKKKRKKERKKGVRGGAPGIGARETLTNDDGKNDENHHNDKDGKLHVLPVHLLVDLLAASLKRLGVLGKGLCATDFKRSNPSSNRTFRIDGSKTAPSSHTSCREFPQESTVHKEEEEEEEESQSYQS